MGPQEVPLDQQSPSHEPVTTLYDPVNTMNRYDMHPMVLDKSNESELRRCRGSAFGSLPLISRLLPTLTKPDLICDHMCRFHIITIILRYLSGSELQGYQYSYAGVARLESSSLIGRRLTSTPSCRGLRNVPRANPHFDPEGRATLSLCQYTPVT